MIRRSLVLVFALAIAPSILLQKTDAAVVSRTTQPQPQRQVRPPLAAPAWHPVPHGPHILFGRIASIKGDIIAVQLRNGRLQNVDAAAPIANGNYSAPLFVGKFVSVDGTLVGGTFVAAHIFRQYSLDQLPTDK